MSYRIQVYPSIEQFTRQSWNALVLNSNNNALHPGLRFEYLHALEVSKSVSAEKGWAPIHLALTDQSDKLIGAIPLYIKSHSYGEYVFDWSWAQAYEQEGIAYYPKLLSAIPFTPIQGPKFLCQSEATKPLLLAALQQFFQQCNSDQSPIGVSVSSCHVLFLSPQDNDMVSSPNTSDWMSRHVVQFHWENKNRDTETTFDNFDQFLCGLQQKKRKNIKAERRKVVEAGVQVKRIKGAEITADDLDFFYRCYVQTYAEHFSSPYLSRSFFDLLVQTMPESVLLVLAFRENVPIASSFFIYNKNRLYGRYWGAVERVPCLHFELCYYQAIEFAISEHIQWFEGGAQGEHKMARGLNPFTLKSIHGISQPYFKNAIANFLEREKSHLNLYVNELDEHQAFKASRNGFTDSQ